MTPNKSPFICEAKIRRVSYRMWSTIFQTIIHFTLCKSYVQWYFYSVSEKNEKKMKGSKLIKNSHKHAGTSIHPCRLSAVGSCWQCTLNGRPDPSARAAADWMKTIERLQRRSRSVGRTDGATLSGGGRRGRGPRSDTPPSAHRK